MSVATVARKPDAEPVVVSADAVDTDEDAVAEGVRGGEDGVQPEKRARLDTENPCRS